MRKVINNINFFNKKEIPIQSGKRAIQQFSNITSSYQALSNGLACSQNNKKLKDIEIYELLENSNIVQQIFNTFAKNIANINIFVQDKVNNKKSNNQNVNNVFQNIINASIDLQFNDKISFVNILQDLIKSYIYKGAGLVCCNFIGDELKNLFTIPNFSIDFIENTRYPATIRLESFYYKGTLITKIEKVENEIGEAYYDVIINSETKEFLRFYLLPFNKSFLGNIITPLHSTLKHLMIYQEQLNTTKSILEKQAKPSIIATPNTEWHREKAAMNSEFVEEASSQLSSRMKEKLQGSNGAGGVVVLSEPYNIDAIQPTVKNLYDIETIDKIAIEIASIFGIPAGEVLPQRTYNNATEDTKKLGFAIVNLVQEILTHFSTKVFANICLLNGETQAESYYLTFDNTDISQIKDWERGYATGLKKDGISTINETRAVLGLLPIAGGDVLDNNQSGNNGGEY